MNDLEIIKAGRELKLRFFHGNKLWSSYVAYSNDEHGNLYFPVDQGTNSYRGIKKDAFVSALIQVLNNDTGEVEHELELKGEITPVIEERLQWNDAFTEKYNHSMTKEIAEMMLHKPWYTLTITKDN